MKPMVLKNTYPTLEACQEFQKKLAQLQSEIKQLTIPIDKKQILKQLDNWGFMLEIIDHKLASYFLGIVDLSKWIKDPYFTIQDLHPYPTIKIKNVFQFFRKKGKYSIQELATESEIPLWVIVLADYGIMFPAAPHLETLKDILFFPEQICSQVTIKTKKFNASMMILEEK